MPFVNKHCMVVYKMTEKIIRTRQVCSVLGIAPVTLWRWRRSGIFPEPGFIIGARMRGWPESTVNAWIAKNFPTDAGEPK